MDVQITRSNDIWKYSPLTDGYSDGDFFGTISGTPAIASNKLRLNAAEIASISSFKNASVEMLLTIPVVPTAGDVRIFGWKAMDDGDLGRAEFEVTDDEFFASVYEPDGTLIASKPIPWDSDWTADIARYRISMSENNIFFAINNVIVARFENTKEITADVALVKKPLEIHVSNENSDNLDITSINTI